MASQRSPILAYVSCGLFSASQALLFVMYPVLAEAIGLSLAQVVACFSVGSFLFLWGGPYWAMRSDKDGRESILRLTQWGIALSLGLLILLLLPLDFNPLASLLILLFGRIAYGALGSGLVPVSQALVLDRGEEKERLRYAATHSMILNTGRLLGPVIGLLLAALAPIYIVGFFFACFLVLSAFTKTPSSTKEITLVREPMRIREIWPTGRDRQAIILMALLSTVFLGILQSSLGAYLQGAYDLTAAEASQLMAKLLILGALTTVGVQFAMRTKLKDPWQGTLPSGALSLLLGALSLLGFPNLAGLIFAIVMMSIGIALLTPSYTSALSQGLGKAQGKASGALSAAHTLGYALGGGLSAAALGFSDRTPFYLAVLVALGIAATLPAIYGGRPSTETQGTTLC